VSQGRDVMARKIVVIASIVVVAAVVVGGLIMMGPPSDERARRLDARRRQDLQGIQAFTDIYFGRHARLPASLDDLAREDGAGVKIRDPRTAASYEFHVIDQKKYELCAIFERASTEGDPRPGDFWSHGAGRRCFELKVKEQGK